MAKKYIPRGEFVLVRQKTVNLLPSGVMAPDTSREANHYYVEAVGPDVEDLEVGDRVEFLGGEGFVVTLPNEKGLFLLKQQSVVCKIKEEK